MAYLFILKAGNLGTLRGWQLAKLNLVWGGEMITLWCWLSFREGFFTCINISFSLMQECSCTVCTVREKAVRKITKRNKMTQNWTPKEMERRNLWDAKKRSWATWEIALDSLGFSAFTVMHFSFILSLSCSFFLFFCLGDRVGLRQKHSWLG